MLKEKKITIDRKVSENDCGKTFILHQLPATRMKNLLFDAQNIYRIVNGPGGSEISINSDKKEELYYSILDTMEYECDSGGKKTIMKLSRDTLDAYVSDVATMDHLVNSFWDFNTGGKADLLEKSLDALTGIC